jgi:hypothetical protein
MKIRWALNYLAVWRLSPGSFPDPITELIALITSTDQATEGGGE